MNQRDREVIRDTLDGWENSAAAYGADGRWRHQQVIEGWAAGLALVLGRLREDELQARANRLAQGGIPKVEGAGNGR